MKPKRGVLGGAAAVALILGACVPDNSVQKGAPVLTSVLVSDPSAGNVTGTRAIVAVDGSVDPVEPLLVPLYLVFDRLLDASTLEDVVYDPDTGQVSQDGGLVSRPGIVNMVADSQGVLMPPTTTYTSGGHPTMDAYFVAGPNIRLDLPNGSLPAGTTVTVLVDATKVRSQDQQHPFVVGPDLPPPSGTSPAMLGTPVISFTTAPMTAAVSLVQDDPTAPPASDTAVSVVFNVLTPDDADKHIQVTGVAADMTPIANLGATVARDPANPAGWLVSPPMAGWPAGASITVTVDAMAADVYGTVLGAPQTLTFGVKP